MIDPGALVERAEADLHEDCQCYYKRCYHEDGFHCDHNHAAIARGFRIARLAGRVEQAEAAVHAFTIDDPEGTFDRLTDALERLRTESRNLNE